MKLGICNELFVNWPWEKICEFASGVGYQGIEVAPFTSVSYTHLTLPTN